MWATVWHHVRDYDAWRPVYDQSRDLLQRYGCTDDYVYRGTKDPNDVIVALEFPDRGRAEAFFADPALRDAMRRSGVDSEPTLAYSEPARVKAPA